MYSFKKQEKLRSQTIITNLFGKSKSVFVYPYKIIWAQYPLQTTSPAQVAISVAKKRIRRAVDRNLLKRRTREAYRLNKAALYETLLATNTQIVFMVVYVAKEPLPYSLLEKKMIELLQKLQRQLAAAKN